MTILEIKDIYYISNTKPDIIKDHKGDNYSHEYVKFLENHLLLIANNATRERVILMIKKLAQISSRRVGTETLITHDLSQQEMANYCFCTRQSVVNVLTDLKKRNLIHIASRNRILVRNLKKLK